MGIRFDNNRVDASGVNDRRGKGGAAAVGGGVSVIGIVVYLLISVLGGGSADPSLLFPSDGSVASEGSDAPSDLQERCNTDGAIDKYDDCFLVKVFNEINEVWDDGFDNYKKPTMTFFSGSVSTRCGRASSSVGPFYCPGDRIIYLDIDFLEKLQDQLGAQGRYAQAYVLAHEAGHHLQTLQGFDDDRDAAESADPSRANKLSVAYELQADCYAGVWSRKASDSGKVSVDEKEIIEAQNAAEAVGDDRIQEGAGQRVNPEKWTHGSAEQRRTWFTTGRSSGSLDSCDTSAEAG